MIDIVKFERPLIGYRLNDAVVYASVPSDLNDADAKQYGYEQVKSSLEYEQTQDSPSINGADMEAIEEFVPEPPKSVTIKITGDRFVSFEDETKTKTLVYAVEAIDQYGDVFSNYTVDETINNDTYTHMVTATVGDVTETLDLQVYKYVLPVPPEPTIEEQLADKDRQILELTVKQSVTDRVVAENGLMQQEILELLIDMGV